MQQQALSAIVAWVRVERALEGFELELKRRVGITSLQLSVLALCAERPQLPLAALRKSLVMHAATLGQSIDDLRLKGLVQVRPDPNDRRARSVSLTDKGAELLHAAPLAGPLRLRLVDQDTYRLDRLAKALEDAVELFGLGQWDPGRRQGEDRD
jgi:DNA-binding MarR family transcriptional regulator